MEKPILDEGAFSCKNLTELGPERARTVLDRGSPELVQGGSGLQQDDFQPAVVAYASAVPRR